MGQPANEGMRYGLMNQVANKGIFVYVEAIVRIRRLSVREA